MSRERKSTSEMSHLFSQILLLIRHTTLDQQFTQFLFERQRPMVFLLVDDVLPYHFPVFVIVSDREIFTPPSLKRWIHRRVSLDKLVCGELQLLYEVG